MGKIDGDQIERRHWWFTYSAGELRAVEVSNIIKTPVKNESTTPSLTQPMANLKKLFGDS